jgi:hypothetical protein
VVGEREQVDRVVGVVVECQQIEKKNLTLNSFLVIPFGHSCRHLWDCHWRWLGVKERDVG